MFKKKNQPNMIEQNLPLSHSNSVAQTGNGVRRTKI